MSEYIEWVYKDDLARGSRPAYPSKLVRLTDLHSWLEQAKSMQVRSIICLLKRDQLGYYQSIPGGLLEHYREQGFEVVNIPITDPAHDSCGYDELEEAFEHIYAEYKQLPKPVLIHCSAGIDRTGWVIERIKEREANPSHQ